VQLAGTADLVVDVLADREVEHPRPNGENTTSARGRRERNRQRAI